MFTEAVVRLSASSKDVGDQFHETRIRESRKREHALMIGRQGCWKSMLVQTVGFAKRKQME